tara:strand:+ start:402 stop:641 length:240 start_codon:yes stop_codon:yes gene_type:complete
MNNDIKNEVFSIVAEILKVNTKKLNKNSSSKNIKNWDSLANFNILIAIEKKFNIKIRASDYSKLGNLSEIVKIIDLYKK